MSDNTVSTLDGSTFLVSNPNGDIDARPDQPEGLFFKDTRHLSKWILTINGIALDVLSTDSIEYYYAQHFCIPPTGTIYKNPTLSLVRRRFVGNGFVARTGLISDIRMTCRACRVASVVPGTPSTAICSGLPVPRGPAILSPWGPNHARPFMARPSNGYLAS